MKTLTLALALALPSVAFAADGPKRASKPKMGIQLPDYKLDTTAFYLPTGLTVMFQQDNSHPIVSVMSIVNHGASDDPKGAEGCAHFAEHTWFRSTQKIKTGWDENGETTYDVLPSIMDTLQDYGTIMNATTRHDWTDYRTVFSSEHLDMFLQLESNRIVDPYVGVTEAHIETEREVILNEWRRRNEQGFSQLFDHLYASVYPEDHAYHSSSTKESLGNVNLKVLRKYFDDYYTAENTTVMVVGDFDLDEAASLLFENFALEVIDPDLKPEHIFKYPNPKLFPTKASWKDADGTNPDHWWYGAFDPASYDPDSNDNKPYDRMLLPGRDDAAIHAGARIKPDDPRDPPPARGTSELIVREAPIDNRTVLVGWSLPGGFRDDQFTLQMIGNLGGIAMAQWFNSNNYEMNEEAWKKSDIGDSGCFVQAEKIHTTMMCYVEVKNKKLSSAQIAEKIVDQMPTMWNPDLVQMLEKQSMPRARNESLAGIVKSVDLVASIFGGRAEDIVTYAHYTNSPRYHSSAMNKTMDLKALEAAHLASQYLTRKRAVTVVVEPLPDSEIDTTGEGSSYAGASEGDGVLKGGEWAEALTNDDVRNAYVAPKIEGLIDETLPNGLRVLIHPHGEAPVAYTGLMLGGGLLSGEKDAFYFMNAFSDSDAIDYGFGGLQDPLEIAGAMSREWYDEYNFRAVQHASGNVDGAMWMLREEMERTKPSLDGRYDFLRGQRDALKARWGGGSPTWYITDLTDEHLYPGSPGRWSTTWTDVERYGDWGASEVSRDLANIYQPKNATLVVVGNFDGEEVLAHAKQYFGGWQAKSSAVSDVSTITQVTTPSIKEGAKILIFDGPKRTQTQTDGHCRLNYEGPEDKPAMQVLTSLIGNETFTRLRVKEGLAYSPTGYTRVHAGDVGTLNFTSLAVNDGVARTIEVMTELVAKGESAQYDDSLIMMHKMREARSDGLAAQSTTQMGRKLMRLAANHQQPESLSNYGELVSKVDRDQLVRLMKGCNGRMIFTLHGPADVLTPQLDAAGMEYEVVDWKAEGEARFSKFDPKGFKKYSKKKAKAAKKKAEADDGSASAQ